MIVLTDTISGKYKRSISRLQSIEVDANMHCISRIFMKQIKKVVTGHKKLHEKTGVIIKISVIDK